MGKKTKSLQPAEVDAIAPAATSQIRDEKGNEAGASNSSTAVSEVNMKMKTKKENEKEVKEHDYLSHSDRDHLAHILVGEVGYQQKTFYMHKDLLHSVKDYFSDEFDPANPPIPDDMHLRFVTVPTFTVFAQWLYGPPIIFPGLNTKAKIDACITLHFFADEIFNNDFKNLAVDLIQDTLYEPNVYSKKQPMLSNYQINRIFKYTGCSCKDPIRRFCAALVSHHLALGRSVEAVEGLFHKIPKFLREYVSFQNGIRKTDYHWEEISALDDPRIRRKYDTWLDGDETEMGIPMCTFHVHDKGDVCKFQTHFVRESDDKYSETDGEY